jgi:uncharacterized cupredoxin-like copper-binding protein
MRARAAILTTFVAAVVLFATACGSGDDRADRASGDDSAGRTIQVEMVDIAFHPAEVTVAKGEKVTFRFSNKGKIAHDAFIGNPDDQTAHEEQMRDGGDMHDADDEKALTVNPGKTGALTHTFDDVGTIEIGCHQPGHYTAGMKIAVTVT